MIARLRRWAGGDAGQALAPEMMVLLFVALLGWAFLAWLGRLNSTSQDIENTAQAAARAASQAADPVAAERAADRAINASSLVTPCVRKPAMHFDWVAGPTGSWRGGSVTVTLSCEVENREPLSSRGLVVAATDTQVIDRFRESP